MAIGHRARPISLTGGKQRCVAQEVLTEDACGGCKADRGKLVAISRPPRQSMGTEFDKSDGIQIDMTSGVMWGGCFIGIDLYFEEEGEEAGLLLWTPPIFLTRIERILLILG